MPRDNASTAVITAAVLASLVGIALAIWSLAVHRSVWGMMGGGMMGGAAQPDPGPGGTEWAVLVAFGALFVATLAILVRGPRTAPHAMPVLSAFPTAGTAPATAPDPPAAAIPEVALVKLLDEDERGMYLVIRERGGSVLQRDLVSLGTFSKAKITRVLDKLERRGVVVRERHGMTNRVRLVGRVAK